ncbi:AraC family transcriptional regulator [Runella slithyformis]|uniref:Transcriptional regulator, AraC family n=1 Tax=Runella slithyformis (strain ATCC 29530 / DSM 19594 / LMG 11500 / NCIMB 11436 / LSU 4) TaxID=761193 RepID=A0A7U3ZP78_RUNSL|nr:AraC family transcriptional regulator [Runella slithyformis]AEI50821.1 transcriptional regulator, AraC family [Runella slithyformis DSM 19594]
MAQLPIYGIIEFPEAGPPHSFYANDLKLHLESHQFVNTPHKHSTFIAVLFTSGTGTHWIDFNTYEVKSGSIFMLTPGQVHNWTLSEDVQGFVFFHTQAFYNDVYLTKKLEDFPFYYLQTNYPVIYLPSDELSVIADLFKTICEEQRKNAPFKQHVLVSLVDLVYLRLARLYKEERLSVDRQHSHYNRLKQLKKLIDEHFKHKKLPKEYADLLHMTTRHLNRICQETIHQSTSNLILQRVMIEAQRMLIYNNVTVSAVADELGYTDYSYFIRIFKKNVGESPKKFQQRMAEAAFRE